MPKGKGKKRYSLPKNEKTSQTVGKNTMQFNNYQHMFGYQHSAKIPCFMFSRSKKVIQLWVQKLE